MNIEECVKDGERLLEIRDVQILKTDYERWCSEVMHLLRQNECLKEQMREINVKMHYSENEYSEEDTEKSIRKALRGTILLLQEIGECSEREMSKKTAILLVDSVLRHFPVFFRAMFEETLHKRSTLSQEDLGKIQIKNEYDLQRMVYAMLLPIFPTARTEVNSDNGYSGMRADIYLEAYDILIELKCPREGLPEKELTEQMGADGFLYKADTVFFLVYDKNCIVRNPEAFAKAFRRSRQSDGKMVKAIVIQGK